MWLELHIREGRSVKVTMAVSYQIELDRKCARVGMDGHAPLREHRHRQRYLLANQIQEMEYTSATVAQLMQLYQAIRRGKSRSSRASWNMVGS
jgi:hypothetical protein